HVLLLAHALQRRELAPGPPVRSKGRCGNGGHLDHMERPTSALHLTRVTLSLRQLGAEPHTKEVGRGKVYYCHCVRSARSDDGRCGPVAGPSDAGVAYARVR